MRIQKHNLGILCFLIFSILFNLMVLKIMFLVCQPNWQYSKIMLCQILILEFKYLVSNLKTRTFSLFFNILEIIYYRYISVFEILISFFIIKVLYKTNIQIVSILIFKIISRFINLYLRQLCGHVLHTKNTIPIFFFLSILAIDRNIKFVDNYF